MSPFVFGYFSLLIAGSSAAAYYKRTEAFGVLFTVTLASMLFGILWGQVAFWTVGIIFACLGAAAGLGYCFRAYMVMLLPDQASRFMKSAPLTASFGLLVIILTLLMALFAEQIAPYGEREIVGDVWEPATTQFLLGTDNLGRDMFSRLIYGARTTISVALAAGLLSFGIGMFLSFTAAVSGGWIDQVLSRVNDLFLAIPTLIFALVVLAALPQNIFTLVMVMALIDQTRVFRLGRAVAVDIVVQDFVEAARLRGERTRWIVTREILPNALTPLVAEFGLRFAVIMLFLSSLSFLGLGIQPPEQDLGRMIRDNREGIVYGISAALWPGAIIALLALSVNLVVDAILNRTTSLKGGRGG
jgi:peptide/nickel transport system permease protein